MISKEDRQILALTIMLAPIAIACTISKAGKAVITALEDLVVISVRKTIEAPRHYLVQPFRNYLKNKHALKELEYANISDEEKQTAIGRLQNMANKRSLVYIFIKELKSDQESQKEKQKKLFGGFPKSSPVSILLSTIRRASPMLASESIQFYCNKQVVPLDSRLESLPLNEVGIVELYFMKMEAYG